VIVPPIGGLSGVQAAAQAQGGALGAGGRAGQSGALGSSGAVGQGEALPGAAGSGPEGSFSGALTSAISSLDSSQQASDSAAQALATGTVSDPESAVVTVQDAQLEMQLAAQIRTKATEAVQSIFQTQV
jgi:flagellar hook-basal body complex protein FliE